MDPVTGSSGDILNDFSMVCGEIRNLRAREGGLGYELPEQEERGVCARWISCHVGQRSTMFNS